MAQITLNSSGVASTGALALQTNGTTTQATIDTSGRLLVGTTTSSSSSGVRQVVTTSTGAFLLLHQSATSVGGGAIGTDSGNGLQFFGQSGALGSESYAERMRLDASGNLLVGATSSNGKLTIKNPNASGEQNIINIQSAASSLSIARISYNQTDDAMRLFNETSTGTLLFGTNNTERARIDSSGNLLVGITSSTDIAGTTNTGWMLKSNQIQHTSSGSNMYLTQSGSGAKTFITFYSQTTAVGTITTNGSTTAYNTTSDYRLKENIAPMTDALSVVSQLKPCTYKWKLDGSDGQGFIAHELQAVVPDCVTGAKDAVDEDGKPVYQGIDVSFLVATLTAAIQELKAEFDAYKASHP
jgi:hypothetical protein